MEACDRESRGATLARHNRFGVFAESMAGGLGFEPRQAESETSLKYEVSTPKSKFVAGMLHIITTTVGNVTFPAFAQEGCA